MDAYKAKEERVTAEFQKLIPLLHCSDLYKKGEQVITRTYKMDRTTREEEVIESAQLAVTALDSAQRSFKKRIKIPQSKITHVIEKPHCIRINFTEKEPRKTTSYALFFMPERHERCQLEISSVSSARPPKMLQIFCKLEKEVVQ
jgi:hypothetical protein